MDGPTKFQSQKFAFYGLNVLIVHVHSNVWKYRISRIRPVEFLTVYSTCQVHKVLVRDQNIPKVSRTFDPYKQAKKKKMLRALAFLTV